MNILEKLFHKRRPPYTPVAAATRVLERFATATSMGIDREDLGRYPAKQRKVMAFHFGAIECLAEAFALDETEMLAVFVVFLDRYFSLPVTETGSISEHLQGFRDNPDECRYLEAGRDVFHRWHEHDERRAPLVLGEMLQAD